MQGVRLDPGPMVEPVDWYFLICVSTSACVQGLAAYILKEIPNRRAGRDPLRPAPLPLERRHERDARARAHGGTDVRVVDPSCVSRPSRRNCRRVCQRYSLYRQMVAMRIAPPTISPNWTYGSVNRIWR